MANENDASSFLRNRLVSALAVAPSVDWLLACTGYLRRKQQREATVDEVVFQLLHSDLRDVVRPQEEASGFGTAANALENQTQSEASKQLREAVRCTTFADRNYQTVLPESFALLCQLEEATDVSKSAEQRLAGGSSGNSQQQQPRYGPRASAARCCKVCLSDGYASGNNAEACSLVVGTETIPIKGLTPDALAGCKILLKGPLEVRHGILLLTPGNCVVVGGCCPDLVQHQCRATAAAQKKAGVGVDPTVRALIGSTGFEASEENGQEAADEAHEASGDVIVRPPPPHAPQHLSSRHSAAAANPTISNSSERSNHRTNGGHNINNTYHEASRDGVRAPPRQQHPPSSHLASHLDTFYGSNNTNTNTTTTTNNAVGNNNRSGRSPLAAGRKRTASQISNHSNTNHFQRERGEPPPSIPPASSLSVSSSTTSPYRGAARNPYAVANRNPRPAQQQLPKRQRPVAHSSAESDTSRTATAPARITPVSNHHPLTNPSSSSSSISSSNNEQISRKNHETTTAAASATASSVQKMDFANLRKLLSQLVGNRDMYESYYKRKISFVVELLVPNPSQIFFNTVRAPKPQGGKSKSPTKKPKKKYEYFTSACFASPTTSTHDKSPGVACKIHPDLLEPCFEVSANDARALSKTDRDKCGALTHAGGLVVKQSYFGKRVWRAALHLSADQVFGQEQTTATTTTRTPQDRLQNLQQPILLLGATEPR